MADSYAWSLAVAVLAAGIGAYAATNYGTQSDPLVAMSYLEKVLGPKMEQQLDEQIAEAAGGTKSQYGAGRRTFRCSAALGRDAEPVARAAEMVPRQRAPAPLRSAGGCLRAAPSWPLAARSLQITSYVVAPAPA
ncbi:MAG: hypothetical protein ACLTSG_13680 [Lachnospiraceae bacterium]